MKLLDLFSGIGGFSLAAHWAGIETIGFCEIDPYACAVLDKHWPNVKNYGDIRNITAGTVERPDIITGGVPCQPASIAGKRRGEGDERWLWPEAIRVLRELRPDFGVFENPTGIVTLHGGYAFERILREISASGYDVWWEDIPACAVGADHRRERIFIVTHLVSHRWGQTGARELATPNHQIDPDASGSRRNGRGQETGNLAESQGAERRGMQQPAGLAEHVADTDGSWELQRQGSIQDESRRSGNGIEQETANLDRQGLAVREVEHARQEQPSAFGSDRIETPETDFSLLREVHGLPKDVDRRARIKCLGNSIVPQAAYCIMKAIKTLHESLDTR